MRNFKSLSLPFLLLPSLLTCVPIPVPAQSGDYLPNTLVITGASSEEDLDEQEVERFLSFMSRPLEINLASRSKLLSSGLLSQYQVASLQDYRSRNGDVLSFSELASVDGFGTEYVAALKPFISLSSRSLPGVPASDSIVVRQEALARLAVKGSSVNHGEKYDIIIGDFMEVALASRTYYKDPRQFPPSSWSASVTIQGKKTLDKLVIGDYNLRLGQGLSLWSGMSLSGFSSASSFSRRPTGLSRSWSWSGIGSHRGAAADFRLGRFSLLGFMSFPGLRETMGGASLGWFGRNGQISATAWRGKEAGKVSGDFRWNMFGVDIFGETAFDLVSGTVASVAGVSALLGEGWRLSGVARLYPEAYDGSYSGGVRSWSKTSDERGVALGLERYGAQFTADLAARCSDKSRRQLKTLLKLPFQLSGDAVLSFRMNWRYRPYEEPLKHKVGARLDLDWSSAGISARYGEGDADAWKGRARIEGCYCRSLSGLAYLEAGRKTGVFSSYLRGTLFVVDNWDDRIYSYERDAPGNFTVPAYYGRGYALSFVAGCKPPIFKRKTLRIYLRVSRVAYPLMDYPKPSVAEAKLQAVMKL